MIMFRAIRDVLQPNRRCFVGTAAMAMAAAGLGMLDLELPGSVAAVGGGEGGRLPNEGDAPSLSGATAWINSPALTTKALRGKVVLVNFCTYTCINWLRTLPYVRAWAETYRDRGLVVLGVHTPEFSFERDLGNVRRAVESMRIGFPVALDSEYAIWQAFANHYWPA